MNKLSFLEPGEVSPVWDEDFLTKVTGALNKKYISFLENETILVEAGFNKTQVQIKTTLKKNDDSVVYPIEAVYIVNPESKLTAPAVAELMLDYLDAYWNEYFTENRDVYVLLDWSKHECEGFNFYMRGFVRNQALENQADALLRQHGFGDYNIEPISSET